MLAPLLGGGGVVHAEARTHWIGNPEIWRHIK
jgi:hypothetical protein